MAVWCRVTVLGPDGRLRASWPVCRPGRPDLGVVEGLARLQLAARRQGGRVVLVEPCAELVELLDLVGLLGAVGLRREVEGNAEGREDVLAVEEAVEPGDPVA